MNINKIHIIYFIGIGGIGMSALARYFNILNKDVYGYDLTQTELTDALVSEGIEIHFKDDVSLIDDRIKNSTNKENILVVYTPAIPKNHSELNYFINNNFNVKKRSEVLGIIAKDTFTIAVAGTHGKTTISSMIAHILKTANKEFNAFIGGITNNYNTNCFLSKESRITLVEADEYDKSFLTLYPDISVISSIDADHLDIYGNYDNLKATFMLFVNQIKQDEGVLVINSKIDLKPNLRNIIKYSTDDLNVEYHLNNFRIINGDYIFDVISHSEDLYDVRLGVSGNHNIENSLAAISVAQALGINNEKIKEALSSFSGVKRRFDYQIKSDKLIFIDDYAHHPKEIEALINSVRTIYPDKKITGIFQPHLFSRTRDLADEFAKSLDLLDELILLDIYPARELPIAGVDSTMLLNKVKIISKEICSKEHLINSLLERKLEIILTIGAGDIDKLVEPIKINLQKQISEN